MVPPPTSDFRLEDRPLGDAGGNRPECEDVFRVSILAEEISGADIKDSDVE